MGKYALNLTLGLIGAFFAFVYNVYFLLISYGASFLSALSFLLLAVIAGLSVIAAYLGTMYGVIAGGGMMLIQQAAAQEALESGRRGRRREIEMAPRSAGKCPV